ncbi:WG repeat-containing protein [Rubricoccus marinus]|nr:WG repeat-containing protein [Rubricoccus marinus]
MPYVSLRSFLLLALLALTGCAGARVDFTPEASSARVEARDIAAGEGLFPVVEAGRWGYMDRRGEVVISPRFQFATPFSEGLAAAKQGNLWGYLSPDGTWAIAPQFASARGFSDGRGLVGVGGAKERRFGFVDATGAFVVPTVLPYALSYSEGLALVRLADKQTLVQKLFSPRSTLVFLDRDGEVAVRVPASGISAASFSGGLAPYEKSQGLFRSTTWGYLDAQGREVIAAELDGPAFRHTDGLARVASGGEVGFVDRGGEFVIPPQYALAFSFSEGFAPVQVGGAWGFADASGALAIAPRFQQARGFSEGLAAVQVGRQWGYIDAAGDLAIRATYTKAEPFARGLARVYEGRLLRYIDASGAVVWAQD